MTGGITVSRESDKRAREEEKQDQELKDRLRRAMRIVRETARDVGLFGEEEGGLRDGERAARQVVLFGMTILVYSELREMGTS